MKLSPLVILFLVLFLSCNRDGGRKNEVDEKDNIQQSASTQLASFCFYGLDDKYGDSNENDSGVVIDWLRKKSELILKSKSTDNIFSQPGGGPNGAEWNPSADLFVAILHSSPAKDSTDVPKLLINGKRYEEVILEYNKNLTWYSIQRGFWENELRAIDAVDITKMYSSEFLNEVKNGNAHPVADLHYGEILKFEAVRRGDTLPSYFHAAYGE